MTDRQTLEDMARVRITEADPGRLRDILEVRIEGESACRRLESWLRQVENPYCFRVGKTPVGVSFRPCEETLEEKVRSCFLGLKTGGGAGACSSRREEKKEEPIHGADQEAG